MGVYKGGIYLFLSYIRHLYYNRKLNSTDLIKEVNDRLLNTVLLMLVFFFDLLLVFLLLYKETYVNLI